MNLSILGHLARGKEPNSLNYVAKQPNRFTIIWFGSRK